MRLPPDSTLGVFVQALDRILADVTTMKLTLDATHGMDAVDSREMKRRLAILAHEAESFLHWVCDQRDFNHPHN